MIYSHWRMTSDACERRKEDHFASPCTGARGRADSANRGQDAKRCDPGRAAAEQNRASETRVPRRTGLLEQEGQGKRHPHRGRSGTVSPQVRVVFDTNILISAIVFPGKRGEEALSRIVDRKDDLIISKPIIHEVLSVLARKFGRDREELARTAVLLAGLGEIARPQ